MRILYRYLARDYVLTFVITVAVFTFVMCVGSLVRAIDLMSRGVSGSAIATVFLLNIPFILQFTIPMSTLTTVLLLFTRLSIDGELTAMKACGMSLWQIIAPVVMLSILLSFFCMYLSNSVSPRARYAQRHALARFGEEDPLMLLEEGRFVRDFPGLMIYVGRRDKNRLEDIIIYEMQGNRVKSNIRARWGTVERDRAAQEILINLHDVRIEQPDPHDPMDLSKMRNMTAEDYPKRINVGDLLKRRSVRKKISDYSFRELTETIRNVRRHYPALSPADLWKQKMTMLVEASNRMALSLSCFAFTLLGIPLGMRSRRRESSVGVGISLGIVFIFYFFMVVAKSMTSHPEWRPDLVVWIPVVIAEIVGFLLIRRAN